MILILLISFFYLIFLCWLISGLNNLESNDPDIRTDEFVSIIVAAKNERENIEKLLNSLIKQTYPQKKYEIIISNDKSTDKTEEILNRYKNKIKNLKVIKITNTPPGWTNKKWALNTAINESKGNIIIQTDGDCVPEKKWIEKMILPFSNVEIGFVLGFTPLKKRRNNFLSKLLVFENMAQDAFNASCVSNGLTISCVGRSIAFRKKYFNNIGGYADIKSITSGDDDLLMHRIINANKCKMKYVISKNSYVYSFTPKSTKEFINQRLRFASKGKLYFKLFFVSSELKLILPFLYIVNLSIIITLFIFINNPSFVNLLPWLIKLMADALLILTFSIILKIKWDVLSFSLLSILHPFYIILFSSIAPFKRVNWK